MFPECNPIFRLAHHIELWTFKVSRVHPARSQPRDSFPYMATYFFTFFFYNIRPSISMNSSHRDPILSLHCNPISLLNMVDDIHQVPHLWTYSKLNYPMLCHLKEKSYFQQVGLMETGISLKVLSTETSSYSTTSVAYCLSLQ